MPIWDGKGKIVLTYRPAPPIQTQQPSEAGSSDYRTRLMGAVEQLPPLSTVLSRLLQMLNDELCSSVQIASLIEQDSVLSGSVLRCVNSAYYGISQRISSIRQAVTLLGFGTVRNLALAFSMKRLVRPRSAETNLYSLYSQHALGCAVMTEFLAHYVRSEELDAAFAAGLFHDIGQLLILTTFPEMIPQIVSHWESSDKPMTESEQTLLNVTHPELSALVLEKWKLPDEVCEAARHHESPADRVSTGEGMDLATLVYAADVCVCYDGLALHLSSTRPPDSPEAAFRMIGLEEALPDIREKFEAQFASIRSAFPG